MFSPTVAPTPACTHGCDGASRGPEAARPCELWQPWHSEALEKMLIVVAAVVADDEGRNKAEIKFVSRFHMDSAHKSTFLSHTRKLDVHRLAFTISPQAWE